MKGDKILRKKGYALIGKASMKELSRRCEKTDTVNLRMENMSFDGNTTLILSVVAPQTFPNQMDWLEDPQTLTFSC